MVWSKSRQCELGGSDGANEMFSKSKSLQIGSQASSKNSYFIRQLCGLF